MKKSFSKGIFFLRLDINSYFFWSLVDISVRDPPSFSGSLEEVSLGVGDGSFNMEESVWFECWLDKNKIKVMTKIRIKKIIKFFIFVILYSWRQCLNNY